MKHQYGYLLQNGMKIGPLDSLVDPRGHSKSKGSGVVVDSFVSSKKFGTLFGSHDYFVTGDLPNRFFQITLALVEKTYILEFSHSDYLERYC